MTQAQAEALAEREREREKRIAAEARHRDRRERIATACMAGLLSKALSKEATYGGVASGAVIAADALIAELDKPKEVQP